MALSSPSNPYTPPKRPSLPKSEISFAVSLEVNVSDIFFARKELSSVFIPEFGNLLSTTSSADFKIFSFFLLVYTFPGT